ncbi:MAG: type II secretion system F family protein, partial [Clostridia bacterium]|nr:type II secretion system F family protein [Clostridia bacterium]
MPEYSYRAVSMTTGETEKGVYTAKSKIEAIEYLRHKRQIPILVEELKGSKEIPLPKIFVKVKTKDLAVLCRQFYAMLNAGISIVGCLDILTRQTENKILKSAMSDIYEEVQKGASLSETMKKRKDIFPELLINMIDAGEISGNLDTIMERMAVHFEKENKILNKIQGAMMYPIILSLLAIGVVIFLLIFIMPTFISLFEGSGAELPLPTRILLKLSDVIKNYWYILLMGIIGAVIGSKKALESDKGGLIIDNLKFRLPVVKNATKMVITSRFSRTLATLLSSGIPLIQALDVVSRVVGNRIVEKGIKTAIDEVRRGTSLAQPIKNMGVFPPMLDSMVAIGEESGSLDNILEKTANFYDDEVETSIAKLTAMMEPVMIVIMALVVGSMVVAMVLPMFSMMQTV